MPPESQRVVEELKIRGIPFFLHTTDEMIAQPLPLQKSDLVVGDFDWTRRSLSQLKVAMPAPPDYPECLKELLHRKVWRSTLGEVEEYLRSAPEGTKVFVKPAEDTKAFSGLVASVDEWLDYLLEMFPPTLQLWCSELVEMVSEYRVYCVNGQVRAVCHYKGPTEHVLDLDVVNSAVRTLFESDEGKALAGCGLDFVLLRKAEGEPLVTALVEVNDGYSLGAYEGLSSKDYTDMCIARWSSLMQS